MSLLRFHKILISNKILQFCSCFFFFLINSLTFLKRYINIYFTSFFSYRRLQGLGFQANYIPTPEIQIAPIFWTYGSHEDQVKVSLYKVVNKSILIYK